jgi:hypothetical protein
MTKKNATIYIQEANRFKRITAPDITGPQKVYDVFSGTSSLEVLERVLHLLDLTGIPYSYYHNFIIRIGTNSMNCSIEIYSNNGAYAKTRSPFSTANTPIISNMDTFVIGMWDTTRFFRPLFNYIVENYSVEEIPRFTHLDSGFGIHCAEDYDMDRAERFIDECQSTTVGGITKEDVAILLK